MTNLMNDLIHAGIVQFGRFRHGQKVAPFLLSFELLPSYPDLLRRSARHLISYLPDEIDRLLCLEDSLPLAVAVGLESGLPVIYSRQTANTTSLALAGAYDIGHKTTLILNALGESSFPAALVNHAERVGLSVISAAGLIALAMEAPVPTRAPFTLSEIAQTAHSMGGLSSQQVRAVQTWQFTHH
ncbi:MAG: hypothetical protein SNJ59_00330 [Aggregatilineales bacterium]